jgi:hypothetical protein
MNGVVNIIDEVTLSESVCARVFSVVFHSHFRYLGNGQWEYFDSQSKAWCPDKNRGVLRKSLRHDFCSMLLQRAKEWQETRAHDHDTMYRIKTLMDLARRLQANPDYVRNVMKETAEWFHVET